MKYMIGVDIGTTSTKSVLYDENGTFIMKHQIGYDLHTPNVDVSEENPDELFDAILALENREECYQFFDDLCTVNEIQSLSQRLQVAKMIKQGYTYATIEEESGASTATISRVKRSLQWGNDAYTMILDRLNIETKA